MIQKDKINKEEIYKNKKEFFRFYKRVSENSQKILVENIYKYENEYTSIILDKLYNPNSGLEVNKLKRKYEHIMTKNINKIE